MAEDKEIVRAPTGEIIINPPASRYRGRHSSYRPEYCEHLLQWFEARCQQHSTTVVYNVVTEIGGKQSQKQEVRNVLNKIPQISDWAWEIGSSIVTAQDWARKYPEFGQAYARARSMQEAFIRDGITLNLISPAAGAFLLKNLCRTGSAGRIPLSDGSGGWSDKSEISVTTDMPTEGPVFADASPTQLDALEQIAKLAQAAGVRLKIEGFESRAAALSEG